jgi:hypothetical protein
MALRIVLLVLLLAVSATAETVVISAPSHFGQNPHIIDNNHQIATIYRQPRDEHGMTKAAFTAWVLNYIKKNEIKYRRLRFIKCRTCLQREAIDCAVLYF